MGVKVSKVRDSRTLQEVTVKDCENGFEGKYICITKGCNAQMSFVPSYEQRRLEKVIVVPSFFKLKPKEVHSYDHCPYNTRGAVEIIARQSDPDVLKAIDNNKYEFSLQVLHKPEKFKAKVQRDGKAISYNEEAPPKGKKYTRKGTATSYIKALTQILTLRAKVEDDEELASIITLNYRGKKIRWNQFYFEQEHYIKAYQNIDSSKAHHPVCFNGVISKITPETEKLRYPKIKLHSPYIKLKDEITPIPSVDLLVADRKIDLNEFAEDQEILVYGLPKVSSSKWIPREQRDKEEPKTILFLNMNIWINHREQIVKLSP